MWRNNPSKVSYSILNFCNHDELSYTMGWQSLLMSIARDSSTGTNISVSPIPLQRSLFRNNSHSFSCEAVWLLRTSTAPCLHNKNSHSFPQNTPISFSRTTCLNCVERASYDCGGTAGRTNRMSLSWPCTQSPEAHKTNLSRLHTV